MATFLKPDSTEYINGVLVKHFNLIEHNPNKIAMPAKRPGGIASIIGPTMHNTNVITTAAGTTMAEQYTRATYNGNMGTVRVGYYVDHIEAWENLPPEWQNWNSGQSGKAEANGSEKGNQQTIAIECIMDGTNSANSKKAEDNAARLAAHLLDKYGGNLYTHNYWCNVRDGYKGSIDYLNKLNDHYKNCPVFIRPHWDDFVALVNSYRGKKTIYRVQVGAFSSKVNAQNYLETVKKKYSDSFLVGPGADKLYRVQVGAFAIKSNAQNYLKEVQKTYPDSFITEVKL